MLFFWCELSGAAVFLFFFFFILFSSQTGHKQALLQNQFSLIA